ncbi:MAG: hypothetical protein GQ574_26360 [Crocinitomix sp.]|nr:hypothetical protein [Crocinitomix sp.]
MSILTDFIVAKANQEDAILESDDISKIASIHQLSGVGPIKLQTLYNLISDKAPYDIVEYNLTPYEGCAEEGPWLFAMPMILVHALAKVSATNLDSIAEKWNNTEELQMDRWNIEDATTVINDLSALAKKAIETEQVLFLLMSL